MPAGRPRDALIKLLAIGVALIGLGSMVSALTPDLAERSQLITGLVPLQATRTAHILVFELGLLLMIVAFGLVRRRRRAWQLAVVLLAATAVLHLAKGLDVEEAAVSLVLMALLIHRRDAFTVAGARDATRRTLTWIAGVTTVGILLGTALAELVARLAGEPISLHEAADQGVDALVGAPDSMSALGLYTAVGIAVAAILWLRPVPPPAPSPDRDRAVARAILARWGSDSLAYFTLRRDTTLAFAPDESAFLAYRVVANVALVSGHAVGPGDACAALIRDFHEEQIGLGRRVAVVGLPASARAMWEQAGLLVRYIGDEALVDPASFSLEGRAMRKVRQAVARVERDGYRIEIRRRSEIDDLMLARLRAVSDLWLGGQGERGFSMALDDPFAAEHDAGVFAIAFDDERRPSGYIHFVPVPATGGLSLSTMRRRDDAPNGLNEALLCAVFAWGREHGVRQVGLNFSAFGRILRADDVEGLERLAAQALLQGDRWFQLERLDAFNRKFQPTWVPRYAACERAVDLPQAALAILAAEGLIPVPRLPALGAAR